MEKGKEDTIDLMKKDRSELLKNIQRTKRRLFEGLNSVDAFSPNASLTDREIGIKEELIKTPMRHAISILKICYQIFVEEKNKKPKTE